MRGVVLLVVLGGCTALTPPPAGPEPAPPAARGSTEPPLPLTVREVDSDQPRPVCEGKGLPPSEWPDALVRAADSVR